MDGENNFAGKAAEEIKEETGLVMKSSELINLTELALRQSKGKETKLRDAMYPSPGGSDEFIAIFLWEKVSIRLEIPESVTDHCAGSRPTRD
jgi:ADP-sugar diphosphatase